MTLPACLETPALLWPEPLWKLASRAKFQVRSPRQFFLMKFFESRSSIAAGRIFVSGDALGKSRSPSVRREARSAVWRSAYGRREMQERVNHEVVDACDDARARVIVATEALARVVHVCHHDFQAFKATQQKQQQPAAGHDADREANVELEEGAEQVGGADEVPLLSTGEEHRTRREHDLPRHKYGQNLQQGRVPVGTLGPVAEKRSTEAQLQARRAEIIRNMRNTEPENFKRRKDSARRMARLGKNIAMGSRPDVARRLHWTENCTRQRNRLLESRPNMTPWLVLWRDCDF